MFQEYITNFTEWKSISPLILSQKHLLEVVQSLFGLEEFSWEDILTKPIPDLYVYDFNEDRRVLQARDVVRTSAQKPSGDFQVFILLSLDRATSAAQNALLKLFEEGAGRTLFLSTTSRSEGILKTLMSRMNLLSYDTDFLDLSEELVASVNIFLRGDALPLVGLVISEKWDKQSALSLLYYLQKYADHDSIRQYDVLDSIAQAILRLETSNASPRYQLDSVFLPLLWKKSS